MTLSASERPALSGWRKYLADLATRRDFARFLIQGNLTARNASTALGIMWWVLNPLLSAGVYYVVFGLILDGRQTQDHFLTYLVIGVFAFQFTTAALNGGANLVTQNARLLVNVRFPRLILPIAAVAEALTGFVVSLVALMLIALTNGIAPTASILWLVPTLLIHTAFCVGLSAFTARLVVPMRDIGNLIPHVSRFWFYLTPIVWSLSFLEGKPGWAVNLIQANPMYAIVQLYRTAIMGIPFDPSTLVTAVGWMVIVGLLGVGSFVRNEGTMVRYL